MELATASDSSCSTVTNMTGGEVCDHDWGVEVLALADSGDAMDVCVECGELRYVTEDDLLED